LWHEKLLQGEDQEQALSSISSSLSVSALTRRFTSFMTGSKK
jgi:hypothetical protein